MQITTEDARLNVVPEEVCILRKKLFADLEKIAKGKAFPFIASVAGCRRQTECPYYEFVIQLSPTVQYAFAILNMSQDYHTYCNHVVRQRTSENALIDINRLLPELNVVEQEMREVQERIVNLLRRCKPKRHGVRFIGIRVAYIKDHRSSLEPIFGIRISALNGLLVDEVFTFEYDNGDRWGLEYLEMSLDQNFDLVVFKKLLTSENATAAISLTALRMLRTKDGNVSSGLQSLSDYIGRCPELNTRYKLTYGYGIFCPKTDTERSSWRVNQLTIHDFSLSHTAIHALEGKRITALVDHPWLSPHVRIESVHAYNFGDGSKSHLSLGMKQPYFLFNSNSGRLWRSRKLNSFLEKCPGYCEQYGM